MKTEIYVATHKEYTFPNIPEYIPIHVGKVLTDLELNIQGDDTGDNISYLNKSFCELTALYWMWKNSNADILGLVHYRRYFEGEEIFLDKYFILNNLDKDVLSESSVIIAEKERFLRVRKKILGFKSKKYITIEEQYCENHFSRDWSILRGVLEKLYPQYIVSFDFVAQSPCGLSPYNMLLAHRKVFNAYCEWLFSILFEVKKYIDLDQYDAYQSRVFGFMAERLLNIYFFHHRKNLNILYEKVVMID
ncbi:DUF4422 domain-containing protein [Acinetobacter towneri]|uniref:DUF4422 domain-containing protein n=1 Tax=Acinetobacter towneri TaxID=202956 RepID=UPI00321495EE